MYFIFVTEVICFAALFCGGARGNIDDFREELKSIIRAEIDDAHQQYEQTVDSLTSRINQQDNIIADLSTKLKQQDMRIEHLQAALFVDRKDIQEPVHACLGASLSMSCTDGFITVLYGQYGAYNDSCTEDCCPPGELDCTESAADKNSDEWQALKDSCDGKANCSYIYGNGLRIEGCELNYTADYINVVYRCSIDFIGFTAYMVGGADEPTLGDIVTFTGTVSNAGGAYSNDTSHFTCPVSGYYYVTFSLNTLTINDKNSCLIEIVMNTTEQVEARETNNETDAHQVNTMSQGAVLYCEQGNYIWLRADSNNCHLYGHENSRRSTFSAVLLHAGSRLSEIL